MGIPKENDGKNEESVVMYSVPKINTRFPIKRNAFNSKPERQQWVDWVFDMSAMSEKSFSKIRDLNLIATYCFPNCDDIKRYEILTKYTMLFVVYDDHIEDSSPQQSDLDKFRESLEQVFCILEGNHIKGMSEWRPYLFGLYALWRDISLTFNDIQKKRLIELHRLYNIGVCEQVEFNINQLKYNSLEELIKSRNKNIAMYACYQIIEYSINVFVPEHIWESQIWQNLLNALSTFAVYVNDIYSFERELKESNGKLDKMHNCVALISLNYGISIEQSMKKLIELIDDKEREIFETENEIISKYDGFPEVKAFIDGCNLMAGGLLALHIDCRRYNMNK